MGEDWESPDALLRAATAVEDDERHALLSEGTWRFGYGLLEAAGELDEALAEEVAGILFGWLAGATLSDRVDEPERRLAAAESAFQELGDDLPALAALLAVSLLELPSGHPMRDVDRAGDLLDGRLKDARSDGDLEDVLEVLRLLLRYRVGSTDRLEEICDEGIALAARCGDPELAYQVRSEAHAFYVDRALELRDSGGIIRRDPIDEEAYRHWMERADELGAQLAASTDDEAHAALDLAIDHDRNARYAAAAEMYARVVELAPLEAPGVAVAARREAELWLRLGEPERAAEAAAPLVSLLTERYVTAVTDEDVADAGSELGDVCTAYAFALAALGDWRAAVQAIDACKSVRTRYAAALREHPEGRRVLELERTLDRLARDLEPPDDRPAEGDEARLTLEARMLESYRQARPQLAREELESPTGDRLTQLLRPDETVLVLGVHWSGTLVAAVGPGCDGVVLDRLNLRRWIELLVGEDASGWLTAVGFGGRQRDAPAVLVDMLERVDRELGPALRDLVPAGARRVVVIAHGLLHLVPFWALDSLSELDVLMAPSAATLVRSRTRGPRPLEGRAVLVSNPTLDLRASPAEAAVTRRHLEALGAEVVELQGAAATQERVVSALTGAALVHLVVHGRSELGRDDRSALVLAPESPHLARLTDAELWDDDVRFAFDEDGLEREADVPGVGHVRERLHDGGLSERWIEQGAGEPWALFDERGPVAAGQLWQAREIVLDASLHDCRLALLAACESGVRAAGATDEHGGLPAALQLAGADNVVASMWPVSEPVATLFSHLLYVELSRGGEVELDSALRAVQARLREMPLDAARRLVLELAEQSGDGFARMTLEAFAYSLGAARPFARPWDWAAFYVSGSGRLFIPRHEQEER